jgi:hypothetical protein
MHDRATSASKSGNSYMAWREPSKAHGLLVDAMLSCTMHLIATMRSKTEYAVTDDGGKKGVKKIGMAPIQREGMEYEFTTVLDLSLEKHIASASKDRTGLWDNRFEIPSLDMGARMAAWLEVGGNGSGPTPAVKAAQKKADATDKGIHVKDSTAKQTEPFTPIPKVLKSSLQHLSVDFFELRNLLLYIWKLLGLIEVRQRLLPEFAICRYPLLQSCVVESPCQI